MHKCSGTETYPTQVQSSYGRKSALERGAFLIETLCISPHTVSQRDSRSNCGTFPCGSIADDGNGKATSCFNANEIFFNLPLNDFWTARRIFFFCIALIAPRHKLSRGSRSIDLLQESSRINVCVQVSFRRASHSKGKGISSVGRLFLSRVRDLLPDSCKRSNSTVTTEQ